MALCGADQDADVQLVLDYLGIHVLFLVNYGIGIVSLGEHVTQADDQTKVSLVLVDGVLIVPTNPLCLSLCNIFL